MCINGGYIGYNRKSEVKVNDMYISFLKINDLQTYNSLLVNAVVNSNIAMTKG